MEGTKKIKSTSFHQYSWNSEVETTCSGVFSTGATGAIAPVILKKRLIAPVIFLPYSVIILTTLRKKILNLQTILQVKQIQNQIFKSEKFLKKNLRYAHMYLVRWTINTKSFLITRVHSIMIWTYVLHNYACNFNTWLKKKSWLSTIHPDSWIHPVLNCFPKLFLKYFHEIF